MWCLFYSCKCKFHFSQCSNWNTASWAVSMTEDPATIQSNPDLFLLPSFLDRRCSFQSCHRFSIGAISNLALNHSSVYLAVRLESLSCWNLICPSLKSHANRNCFVFKTYPVFGSIPLALNPVPTVYPQGGTLPPPCFHMGVVFSMLGFFQTTKVLCIKAQQTPEPSSHLLVYLYWGLYSVQIHNI